MPILRSYQSQVAQWEWGRAVPNPTGFYVCLSVGSTFTATSTLLDFLTTEVSGNGYARQPITFPSDGAYNPAQNRHEMPQILPQFTAAGGSIVFRTSFIMYNARSDSKKSFVSADINTTSNTITVNAHGLINGEAIAIQDNGLLGMPGGLLANTLYQAFGVAANTFQLSTDGTSAVDITSAGSGPYSLIYAKGGVRSYAIRPANETITNGLSGSVIIDVATSEGVYV